MVVVRISVPTKLNNDLLTLVGHAVLNLLQIFGLVCKPTHFFVLIAWIDEQCSIAVNETLFNCGSFWFFSRLTYFEPSLGKASCSPAVPQVAEQAVNIENLWCPALRPFLKCFNLRACVSVLNLLAGKFCSECHVTSSSSHHLVVVSAWISLTLARHPTLSFIRSSGLLPISTQSFCM